MLQDINSQNVSNKIKNRWAQRPSTWKHTVGRAKGKERSGGIKAWIHFGPVLEQQTFELLGFQKDVKTWRIESLLKKQYHFPNQDKAINTQVQISLVRSNKQASSKTLYNQALDAVRFSRHQEKTHKRCPNLPDSRLPRSLTGQQRVSRDFSSDWRKKITCQAGILHPPKLSIRNKGHIKTFSDK